MLKSTSSLRFFVLILFIFVCTACEKNQNVIVEDSPVFLLIDEESIDNGNEPNNFSDTDVNDQIAEVGLRSPLEYFHNNVGQEIDLFTGRVGDEGWFALKSIPQSWIDAGPVENGTLNFLSAGPGLGSGNEDDNREVLLDEVPNVTPLRATGLSSLVGETIVAVVFDSDVMINYTPLTGSLKGANLGIVSFKVIEVVERVGGSTSSLPTVKIEILGVPNLAGLSLSLFANAPEPLSSSEPSDVAPPISAPLIQKIPAP